MKKNLLLATGIILMASMFTACPDFEGEYIWLRNNSDLNVVGYVGGEDLGEPTYPDTLLPSKNLTRHVSKAASAPQYYFRKDIKNSKVCVFFLDNDTIAKYGWDKVRDEYMILKRVDVDEKYLRQKDVNWTVEYP
ncbi:hypothetical protein [Dysgonomonas sp. 511]|uniref:hypothetical protein n=1 Tax=Dysgonomonas sp. 511 TaxID=2302930 RepID=UPI0013D507CA|nr:hypothetical protein [Dysgonomonas sp. 511]NDV79780.1 hypothetical protein [Dysgonomonas sp. 511]